MKYKISDTPLKLKEYGRNIQSMVEYAKTIEDEDKRTKLVHEIVRIMSNLHPQLKEIPDYKQKLWDHIFLISDFALEVEAPYPILSQELLLGRPDKRIDYYRGKPKFKQYGWNVQLMIQQAVEMPDGQEKSNYINQIANTMKTFLRNMDRETTPEEVIAEQMNEISAGKLNVKGAELTFSKAPTSYKHSSRNNSNNHHNSKRGRNHKHNGKHGGKSRRKRHN